MTRLQLTRLFRPAHRADERGTRERGATSAEYALIASLIAVVVIVAVALLGTSTSGLFNRSATKVSVAAG